MRRFVLALLLLMMLPIHGQNDAGFAFTEKPGPHTVGLKVVEQYDRTRIFLSSTNSLGKPEAGERSRPIQTLIWYPARKTTASRMRVGDYYSFRKTETSFGTPRSTNGVEGWLFAGMQGAAPQSTWAFRDATADPGRFPVVIYAPSFTSTSWENADLCEYLASHGYIVIASPGMGVARESTHDVAGIEAQARDINFLIGYAATLPNTDMSHIAVAGFSWGGLSNLFAASHDDRIRALVALDGSMRYFPGLVKQANVHPDQMTIPLLYIKGEDSIEEQASLEDRFKSGGPSVLNAWTHGDLISIQMLGLIHPEFSSMAQRNERLWQYEYANLQPADYDRADGVIGYAWVARYTLQFLNAYLKSDPEALSYLHKTAAENGVPKHTLAVNFRTAKAIPPSFESFRKQVGDRGFDHIADVYATTLKQEPSFTLDADTVTNWAYDLLAEGQTHEAVAAMQFSLQINPSTSAYISLGEMLARDGQQREALKNYQKAVANDPGNPIAKAFLREYEAAR